MYLNAYSSVHQRNLFFGQFIFFKVLGLSPWTLNFSAKASRVKNTKFTVCKFSYFGTFYNISLATIAISFILYAYHQHNVNQIDSLVTRSITTNLEYLSLIVISLLLVTYTFRQKKMIKIFNEMNNIDQSLQRYAFYSSENGNVIISLIFTFNILICIALATLGYNLPHPFFKTCLRCGAMIFYCWVMMQYTMLLDMIQKRFKFINSNIMKLGNIEEDSKLSPAFSLQRLPAQRRSALHDVINIRHTYHKLCEICEDISEFYGLTILAGMTHNGILVTLVSYFLLVFFMGMIKLDLVSCITYGVIVVWFAFQTTVLTSFVTKTIFQIEKTANVINKLIRQCAMDEKVEKELLDFRCELAFQKIKFTAWGIFSLDRSFLASIAVSIVTYLVLLIEFRLSTR